MTSLQASAGGSKAAKFQAANPLGPMADPFAGLNDDQQEYQKALAENVQKRVEKAMGELKEKHEKGKNEVDDPDRAPTGDPYRKMQHDAAQRERQRLAELQQEKAKETDRIREMKAQQQRLASSQEEESDSDDEWLNDDDPALEAIRNQRLWQLKQKQQEHAENMARGHGQYRTIAQDDFLPECAGSSEWVAIHFFHAEFERCKIMDHHLNIIAKQHTTCKFLRIDAEKAPFFVSKLSVKTLPSLLVFHQGKLKDRLTGFEGLSSTDPRASPDEWKTGRLQEWLAQSGAIEYDVPDEEIQEEMERLGLVPRGAVYRGGVGVYEEED